MIKLGTAWHAHPHYSSCSYVQILVALKSYFVTSHHGSPNFSCFQLALLHHFHSENNLLVSQEIKALDSVSLNVSSTSTVPSLTTSLIQQHINASQSMRSLQPSTLQGCSFGTSLHTTPLPSHTLIDGTFAAPSWLTILWLTST